MPVPATQPVTLAPQPAETFDRWRLVSLNIQPASPAPGQAPDANADHFALAVHVRCRIVTDADGKPVVGENGRPTVEDMPAQRDGSHRCVYKIDSVEEACKTDAALLKLFGDVQANCLRIGVARKVL